MTFPEGEILLAADNEFNREVAKEFLEMTGAAVECAGDGREALEKLTTSEPGHYALILMDVQMPVISGYEGRTGHPRLGPRGRGNKSTFLP